MDDPNIPSEVLSFRSRASSIISTGTKTSIGTLAQPQSQSYPTPNPYPVADEHSRAGIDVHLSGRRNFRITARPGSILSISSFEPPAPPYEPYPSTNASTATLTTFSSVHSSSYTPPTLTPLDTQSRGTGRHGRETPSPPPASPLLTHTPQPSSCTPSPPLSPTLPDPTELSQHYTLVVRTIDANHRAELARLATSHAAALAQTRHAIDAAYRVALRARDVDVEKLKEENASAAAQMEERHRSEIVQLKGGITRTQESWQAEVLALKLEMERREGETETRIERARNEVEDLWEGRWRDRMRIAEEEVARVVQRVRLEEGRVIEGLRREEGEVWVTELGKRWPERKGEWEVLREVIRGR